MRNLRGHRWPALAAAVCCAAMLASSASAGAQPRAASHRADAAQAPRHIFYIMMENHGYHEIIGNRRDAPFINDLARRANAETNWVNSTLSKMTLEEKVGQLFVANCFGIAVRDPDPGNKAAYGVDTASARIAACSIGTESGTAVSAA